MASNIREDALELHRKKKGKLEIRSKVPIKTKYDLTLAYTPGVAEVCKEIAKDKKRVFDYTIKSNSVAVVSDGSSVLGLGNIGPEAGLPVMEGKAILFKEFANIDAFPICLNTQNPEEIVKIVKNIAPVFGGINLEDISAPRCFEVEEKLQDIGIPVFHDDQHGTAIVVLASLINASEVLGKDIRHLKVVISGAGAAGTAISKLLLCLGVKETCTPVSDIILTDSVGIIHRGRKDMNSAKIMIANSTNRSGRSGSIADAMKGADVFIGVSKGNLVTCEMVKTMAKDPIIFAMANPIPEIMPEEAIAGGAAIVGTGRSDFPNQINNVLVFPGIFRGALDVRASVINSAMKLAAAHALSGCVQNPSRKNIIPSALDKTVVRKVAEAVSRAAIESGVAQKEL